MRLLAEYLLVTALIVLLLCLIVSFPDILNSLLLHPMMLFSQTRLDVPGQTQGKSGQTTIVDLSQLRNYVSLQRAVCVGAATGWNCAGLEYYKFTMPDGSIRDFMVTAPTAEQRADIAAGPPKWTIQSLK